MQIFRTRRIIDDAGADAVLAAAETFALEQGSRVVIAIVDPSGELIQLRRTPGAQIASSRVAIDKARTAAIYRRPSKDFEDQASNGRPSALHLARAVPLQGGMPIVHDGEVVGGIGVSGASSADEDQELSVLGSQALAAPRNGNGAWLFPRELVEATFETGGLLLDASRYKIDAGRRERPGEVEYHARVTDVMHVLEGSATVVTGGTMLDPREVAPGELRASGA